MNGAASASPWHALDADEVLGRLATTSDGLAPEEARARLARYGPNALRSPKPRPAWRILLDQLWSVVVLLLAAAAGVALASGDPLDAAAIGAVLFINLALGFVTELPARRAMEALLALEVPRATVIRAGAPSDIDAHELVAGDVITLEAGQFVPADARLIRAAELRTVEAALTGESLPVEKRADVTVAAESPLAERPNMVYQATTVVAGSARGVVVATAMATEVGRIGVLAGGIAEQRTPLERRLDVLGRGLAGVALAVAALVAGLELLHGRTLGEVVQLGLALGIAAVPEGLPVVATIAMAIGMRRMARRRALIRRLPVVETLGSATLICTDKTGTLTAGEMTATTFWVAGRELAVSGVGYTTDGGFFERGFPVDPLQDPVLTLALRIGVLASRADLVPSDGGWKPRGDPTETALLIAAHKASLGCAGLREQWPEVGELPFSSERRFMAIYHRSPEGGLLAHVKGAPDRLLELCQRRLAAGREQPLDERGRQEILEWNLELASRGLRVLALASGPVSGTTEGQLRELTFVGLVGLIDPPAPAVRQTIRQLREAGIRTIMLTGDQHRTAEAIARSLGIVGTGQETLDSRELDRLSDAELDARVEQVGAFTRVSPEGKLRIVSAYQRQGEIVAMLGDGVNDAVALRKADIGVAMGRRGTDLARAAAGVILQDDRLQTVAAAVEEGRVIFDNIRKFVFYLFSCNLAEILVFLGAGLAGLPAPLLPLQILWLNLVTDTFPALALAVEPAEPDLMRRPPRDPRSTILSGPLLGATAIYAALISLCTLAAFGWGLHQWPSDPRRAMTLAFMTLAAAQIFHLGNARSPGPVASPRRALANPYALGAVALTIGLQLLAAWYGSLARVLGVHPLSGSDWLLVAVLGLVPAVVGQSVKSVQSWHRRSAS